MYICINVYICVYMYKCSIDVRLIFDRLGGNHEAKSRSEINYPSPLGGNHEAKSIIVLFALDTQSPSKP